MAEGRLRTIRRHLLEPNINRRDVRPFTASATARVYADAGNANFRYTLDDCRLSYAERKFYEDNGFLVVPGLVTHEEIEQYRQRFMDVCEGRIPKFGMTVMNDISLRKLGYTGEKTVNKIQDFCHDEVLFGYCQHPKVLKYVEAFCGKNIMAMHTMLINKPPDAGSMSSRHPLHQDQYYFPFGPEDRVVAAWTAMEKITRANGCLVVLPGSHKGELLAHGYPEWNGKVNKLYHGILNMGEDTERIHLEMEKGDTVFFHPLLIHGSGANKTEGFRKAISCHYAASECEYKDVSGTVQETVAEELEKLAEKRGFKITFSELWQLRSRLAQGERINL